MNGYRSIFERLILDPRYLANLDWGRPRRGHPEGTIRAHIADIERNLDLLRLDLPKSKLSDEDYWKLKLLIHAHDSFKGESRRGAAIRDPKSHASLARDFLASYCDDPDLLAMVQYHDVPFALYRQTKTRGACDRERFDALLSAISDWNLFLAFEIIDGCTPGKSREPLHWLFREIGDRVQTDFNENDILGE